jgi:mannose-6-phosphate isomerase-like protein (cupin superfamily)
MNMIKDKETSEHYLWGNNCHGWRLLVTVNQGIIEEEMPPYTEEVLHYHAKANQFFYILDGSATFLVSNKEFKVSENQGIQIEPEMWHKIQNRSDKALKFLVISNPPTQNDRYEKTV